MLFRSFYIKCLNLKDSSNKPDSLYIGLKSLNCLINEMNKMVVILNNKNDSEDILDSALTLSYDVYEKFKDLYLKI